MLLISTVNVTQAGHWWAGFHWRITAQPLSLDVGDNVTPDWDAYLDTAIADWSSDPTVLSLTKVPSSGDPVACDAVPGMIKVCNAHYGTAEWGGLTQMFPDGFENHLYAVRIVLNDDGLHMNEPSYKQYAMSQEIGHALGLDHQDTNVYNDNLGSCMDYSDDTTGVTQGGLDNEHPNAHDHEELSTIYGHTHTTTTIGACCNSTPAPSCTDNIDITPCVAGGGTSYIAKGCGEVQTTNPTLCGAATVCKNAGQACTADADCCITSPSMTCTTGMCTVQNPTPPPCSAAGAACVNSADCCANSPSFVCAAGACQLPPPPPPLEECADSPTLHSCLTGCQPFLGQPKTICNGQIQSPCALSTGHECAASNTQCISSNESCLAGTTCWQKDGSPSVHACFSTQAYNSLCGWSLCFPPPPDFIDCGAKKCAVTDGCAGSKVSACEYYASGEAQPQCITSTLCSSTPFSDSACHGDNGCWRKKTSNGSYMYACFNMNGSNGVRSAYRNGRNARFAYSNYGEEWEMGCP